MLLIVCFFIIVYERVSELTYSVDRSRTQFVRRLRPEIRQRCNKGQWVRQSPCYGNRPNQCNPRNGRELWVSVPLSPIVPHSRPSSIFSGPEWCNGLHDARSCICHSRCRRSYGFRWNHEVSTVPTLSQLLRRYQSCPIYWDTSSRWNTMLSYSILHPLVTPSVSYRSPLSWKKLWANWAPWARALDLWSIRFVPIYSFYSSL